MHFGVVVVVHEHQPLARGQLRSVVARRPWPAVLLPPEEPPLGRKLELQLLQVLHRVRLRAAVVHHHNLHVAVVLLLYGHDGLLERGGVVEGDDAHAHPRAVIALQRVGHVVLVAVFVHEDVMPDHPRLLRGALRPGTRWPQAGAEHLQDSSRQGFLIGALHEHPVVVLGDNHLRDPPYGMREEGDPSHQALQHRVGGVLHEGRNHCQPRAGPQVVHARLGVHVLQDLPGELPFLGALLDVLVALGAHAAPHHEPLLRSLRDPS
mmetsp:Transcript_34697/g.66268  ORF Transcript_34697/g.66268 Transcript_34697/m.66268 type:complete len:264 (+) Transcript_34697:1443-2234(+)